MVVVAVCNDDGDGSTEWTMMLRHHQLSHIFAMAAAQVAWMLVHEMTAVAWLASNNDRLDMMSWHHRLYLVCCATAGVQQL